MSYLSQITNLVSKSVVVGLIGACGVPLALAGGPWNQTYKLLAGDGSSGDSFGSSIAVDGNLGVIGARVGDGNYTGSGSAYVFDINTGQQLFKLLAADGAGGDLFGVSVALSGNLAVVGASGDDDNGDRSGSAYVFDVTTGQQLFKLLASDGGPADKFGNTVAITGNLVVIGAEGDSDRGNGAGAAYLFDATTGLQLNKLHANDGMAFDFFGSSVAMDGDFAVIGARNDGDRGASSGSAYIFNVTTGYQVLKLRAADGAEGDVFGWSVAVSSNLVLIGAQFDDDKGVDSGSAYVFDLNTGQQLFKLLASDGTAYDRFGLSVSISGNLAVVGVPYDGDDGSWSGSAYVFDMTTGQELSKLLAADGVADDFFGISTATNGDVVLIGAYGDDDNGAASGSAYVFTQGSSDCLTLTVDNLIAGQKAIFTITGGTIGERAVTVYGTKAGQTIVNNVSGYCATFGIKGVSQSKVLGGLNQTFDNNGNITFNQTIPGNASGTHVFFQSAEQGTCPNECISNLIDTVVQ